MSDISFALEAKSDQLNFDDIADTEVVITVSDVRVQQRDQPVWVYYHGCNNRPWKPSKGMLRILAAAWGRDTSAWYGQSAKLYGDKTVKWAGKEVGGIRIRALTGVSKSGLNTMVAVARGKREPVKVEFLSMDRPMYPDDRFQNALPAMTKAMQEGKSVEQIVAQCQKTGDLTPEQLKQLEQAAPVNSDDSEE